MRNKLLLIIACLLMGYTTLTAQRILSGTVYEEKNRPLTGATVAVAEHPGIGTTTDTKGRYRLALPEDDKLTISVSYMGYVTRTFAVKGKGNIHQDVYLREEEKSLSEFVVTGTRTPKLLKDVPIITRVITMDEIKKVDATHIGDLLQSELPGIEFSYAMNQQTTLNLQGFGGNSILFLVDGERIAGETMNNIDYNRLTLDNVERIEIVKGASSSLYGSNAVGGVINVISRTPSEPWSANVNMRWGAYNDQRYGAVFNLNSGLFSNSFSFQHNRVNTIDMKNKGDFTKVFGNKTWNFKDRLIFSPNQQAKVTARAGYFFRERDSQESSKERYRGFNGGLKGNYKFNSSLDGEVAYAFDQYDKSDFNVLNQYDIRDYSNVQHSVRTVFNQTFADKNILTIGADFMRDYLMSYQFEDDGSHRQYTADAFAQFDWSPTLNFNIISGLRYDYFSESKMQRLSPKLGLMYKLGKYSLRGSYAGGFRAPTLKEMYMNFDMASIFMIYGNPLLKPESSHNFLLSAEYLKGAYNITVSGFYNLVDNRITTAWDKGLNGMVYTNISELKISGMEFNASARYSNGISARLSYAYTHEQVEKGQPEVTSTRPHTATAQMSYDKSWKNYGFSISLRGRYLSDVTTDEYTSIKSYEETTRVTYPGYTIWKLYLNQTFWNGINLNFAVDNLFNYIPKYYYNNSPSTVGTTCTLGLSIDVDKFF